MFGGRHPDSQTPFGLRTTGAAPCKRDGMQATWNQKRRYHLRPVSRSEVGDGEDMGREREREREREGERERERAIEH